MKSNLISIRKIGFYVIYIKDKINYFNKSWQNYTFFFILMNWNLINHPKFPIYMIWIIIWAKDFLKLLEWMQIEENKRIVKVL